MSKREPTIPPPAVEQIKLRQDGNLIKQVRKYKLITPLFGGGVEPGVNDDVTPISGKAIRGHLRFWWRATRGGQFGGDLEKMKQAENLIWGAASTKDNPRPSQIQIEVNVTNKGRKEYPYEDYYDRDGNRRSRVRRGTVVPVYSAFPLQPSSNDREQETEAKFVSIGVEFTLTVRFHKEYSKDIESALWAWETFGGVGARTRRGFGALHLESINGQNINRPSTVGTENEVISVLNSQLSEYVLAGTWAENVPHLTQDAIYEVTDFEQDALRCWNYLIEKLNQFRQQRNPPKIERRGGREIEIPGRSKWPEPEAIRELTKQRFSKHQKIEPNFIKFPRAAFGLPIVFQFKDRDNRNPLNSERDPRKTLLRLADSERLASPLVLRPLAVSKRQFVGIALILDGTLFPDEMKLTLRNDEERNKSEIKRDLRADLEESEAMKIKRTDNRIPLLNDLTDVVEAFLNFLKS